MSGKTPADQKTPDGQHLHAILDELNQYHSACVLLMEKGMPLPAVHSFSMVLSRFQDLEKMITKDEHERLKRNKEWPSFPFKETSIIKQRFQKLLEGNSDNSLSFWDEDEPVLQFVDIILGANALLSQLNNQIKWLYPKENKFFIWIKSNRKFLLKGITGVAVLFLLSFGIHQKTHSNRGLLGFYYKDKNLKTLVDQRVDKTINFDWHSRSPMEGVPKNRFSIRWEGSLRIPRDDKYQISTKSDDGIRVWVGDNKIIDDWNSHAWKTNKKLISLKKGWHKIRIEYFDEHSSAGVKLYWKGSKFKKTIIPEKYLRH